MPIRCHQANGFGELDTLVPAYAATIHRAKVGVSVDSDPVLDPTLCHSSMEPALQPRCRLRHCAAGKAGDEFFDVRIKLSTYPMSPLYTSLS